MIMMEYKVSVYAPGIRFGEIISPMGRFRFCEDGRDKIKVSGKNANALARLAVITNGEMDSNGNSVWFDRPDNDKLIRIEELLSNFKISSGNVFCQTIQATGGEAHEGYKKIH